MSPRTVNIGPCACCGETVVPCTDCLDLGTCEGPYPPEVAVDLSDILAHIGACPECAPEDPPCETNSGNPMMLMNHYDCGFYDNVVCIDGYDLHVFIDWVPEDYNDPIIGYWALTVYCYQSGIQYSWFGCKAGDSPFGDYIHGCYTECMNELVPTITVSEPQ